MKEIEELEQLGWTVKGEINCGGCDGTVEIWVSPDDKSQVEYCSNCDILKS